MDRETSVFPKWMKGQTDNWIEIVFVIKQGLNANQDQPNSHPFSNLLLNSWKDR